VRQEATSQIAIVASPSIRGNPTAECADGNARALSPQDNVEQSESLIRINRQDKNAMKKTKVEPSEESSGMISENRLIRLNQKVRNQTIIAGSTL